jgi:hypothetical protein
MYTKHARAFLIDVKIIYIFVPAVINTCGVLDIHNQLSFLNYWGKKSFLAY